MTRIPDKDRLGVLDGHLVHYDEAELANGVFEIVLGYGKPQMQLQRTEYHDKQEEIAQLESDWKQANADRDAFWGTSPDDENGVWYYLSLYKGTVKARLGKRHPLTRTIPNIGDVKVERYLTILHKFINHWTKVNAALDPDLTLGAFTLADLQAAHDNISAQVTLSEQLAEVQLPLAREQREQLFGDEPEDEREQTSIVARLMLYHATIKGMFPNQPLADSLPEIFPEGNGGSSSPTFRFNFMQEPGAVVRTWLEDPAIAEAVDVFLKEGAVEQTQQLGAGGSNVLSHVWSGLTIVDDLDQLELRDAQGLTVATGTFDPTLPDPG